MGGGARPLRSTSMKQASNDDFWPSLPLDQWRSTYSTLHLMTQVIGKIRLKTAPMVNHWWQITLYLTPRGLSTSSMPHGSRTFQIEFDFIDHDLIIQVDDGSARALALTAEPIASFYARVMRALDELGVPVRIWTMPVEIESPVPLDEDWREGAYDPDAVRRCWRILEQSARLFSEFRSGFVGKCSPVHFFWGGFDLAVTRFSGRRAPEHPGGIPNMADWVTREAYSRECSSCGFWPGGGAIQEPAFYAYAYPEPPGFPDQPIKPREAFYSQEMREFILPYEAVRRSTDPDRMVLDFCQSTYEAGANLAGWDRTDLEVESSARRRL
jgi:hypothetical protein